MTTVDAGTIIDRLEKAVEETKAGDIVSIVLVCQRAHGPPTCSAIFTNASSETQMAASLHIAAIELQVSLLLDQKLEEKALVPIYAGDQQH